MKWQNLIDKKCPNCDERLSEVKDRVVIFECRGCDFMITKQKYFDILVDPDHKMRQFLTAADKQRLYQALQEIK